MPSDNENQKTLEAYERHAKEYIQVTPPVYTAAHEPIKRWIDAALSFLPKNGKVLEIGSAIPRDAQYIQSKGFPVLCSDATPAFVTYLKECGMDAIRLDALRDPIPESFDMIFANAVVSHFTQLDLETVLKKVHDALPPHGIFAFSAKRGNGQEWALEKLSGRRYMHYWEVEDLWQLLTAAGFTVVFLNVNIPGDLPTHNFLHLVLQKTI